LDGVATQAAATPTSPLLDEVRALTRSELHAQLDALEARHAAFSYRACLNPALADWTYLGDFHDRTVLDLTCGFGGIAIPLADRARAVVAVDDDAERAGFVGIISRLDQRANVQPVHAPLSALPLRAQSFDRVLIRGSLDEASRALGSATAGASLHTRRSALLRRAHELLSGGGELWLAVTNRLSPTGSESGSATEAGYARLLAKAGFAHVDFHYAFTNYDYPRFIASSRTSGIISRYVTSARLHGTLKTRLALAGLSAADYMGLAGLFAPCFFIRAERR